MITFNLRCRNEHLFEGWFNSSEDFERQQQVGLIQCPICGATEIDKGLQTPSLLLKKTATPSKRKGKTVRVTRQEAEKALYKLSQYVQQHFEDVGTQFPDEARKIHYGEREKHGIYGQTTPEEEKELKEEGIPIMKIPAPPKFDQ